MTRLIAAGAAALALALGAAACGGGSAAEVPTTASVAPPDSLFANAVVRPEGEEAEAASEGLSKLLDTEDPGAFVVEQLDNLLADEDAGITYAEDIEPWLGENAGIFFTTFSAEPDGAFAVEVTDREAAQETVDAVRAFGDGRARSETYEGINYEVDADDTASGFIDELLVVGTESGFQAAVDASAGDSLADDGTFAGEYEMVPEDSLAAVYADLPAFLDELPQRAGASEVSTQLGAIADGPVLASAALEADSATVEATTTAGELPFDDADLLQGLPAESWSALAVPAFGEYFADVLDQPGSGAGGLDASIRALLGSDLDDLKRWLGDASGFAAGTSIFDIRAALVLETEDGTASANAVGALGRALSRIPSLRVGPPEGGGPGFTVTPEGLPVPIVVTQRDGQVVAGLGAGSVDDALEPDPPLGDSGRFGAAAEALGSDQVPGVFLDFPPMLELLEAIGATEGDPDYESAKPYLDHLDYLVLGGRRDGDTDTTRAVLGLL